MAALSSLRFRAPAPNPGARPDEALRNTPSTSDPSITSTSPPSIRRLLANERYFGVEAQAFRTGAERVLARVSSAPEKHARIDVHTIAHDFGLGTDASWTLLRALVTGGLMRPAPGGSYRPTARFREYASAAVVAPLSRTRAKALIEKACRVADRINDDWTANAFRVDTIAISGSFMSRRKQLSELSLWLIVRPRGTTRQRWLRTPNKSMALRQILQAMNELSSFIVVRIAPGKEVVPRPFSVVFHAEETDGRSTLPGWDRLRQWGASLGRKRG